MKDRELEKQAAAIAQTYIYPLLEIKRDEFMEDARAEDQDDVEDQVRSYIQNELIPSIEALEHCVSDLPLGGGEDYTSEKER